MRSAGSISMPTGTVPLGPRSLHMPTKLDPGIPRRFWIRTKVFVRPGSSGCTRRRANALDLSRNDCFDPSRPRATILPPSSSGKERGDADPGIPRRFSGETDGEARGYCRERSALSPSVVIDEIRSGFSSDAERHAQTNTEIQLSRDTSRSSMAIWSCSPLLCNERDEH
jgi:hypothetical protein